MKLHILGVNGPYPESNGATSGYLLEAADTLLQLDFGSGILARLTAKLPPQSLSAILLTHWHYDHTADLLVLSYLGQKVQNGVISLNKKLVYHTSEFFRIQYVFFLLEFQLGEYPQR